MEEQQIPINGILDLHPFKPSDLGSLIPTYIEECILKEIYEIRFIHGKGTGNIRRSVHALLNRNPNVISYSLANDRSGWGATIVTLQPKK